MRGNSRVSRLLVISRVVVPSLCCAHPLFPLHPGASCRAVGVSGPPDKGWGGREGQQQRRGRWGGWGRRRGRPGLAAGGRLAGLGADTVPAGSRSPRRACECSPRPGLRRRCLICSASGPACTTDVPREAGPGPAPRLRSVGQEVPEPGLASRLTGFESHRLQGPRLSSAAGGRRGAAGTPRPGVRVRPGSGQCPLCPPRAQPEWVRLCPPRAFTHRSPAASPRPDPDGLF